MNISVFCFGKPSLPFPEPLLIEGRKIVMVLRFPLLDKEHPRA